MHRRPTNPLLFVTQRMHRQLLIGRQSFLQLLYRDLFLFAVCDQNRPRPVEILLVVSLEPWNVRAV